MSEYRRSFYKECKQALTSQQHNRLNRQQLEANRNKQRIDQFQLSRKISVSPTPRKRLPAEKENVAEHQNEEVSVEGVAKTSRNTAKVVVTARDPEKIKKQEAFILRFLDWKDKKKAMIEKKKNEVNNKKRPFVSAVSKDSGFGGGSTGILAPTTAAAVATNHQQASFVPKGYHQNFEPPPGLKDPGDIVKEKIKGRQSIFTVVPTPPRKTKSADESLVKKVPLARKILNTNHLHAAKEVKTKLNNKTPVRTDSLNKNAPLTGPKFKSGTTSTSSASKPTAAPLNNLVKNLHNKNNVNSASSKPKSGNTATTTNLKPKSLKMPPPSTVPAKKSIAAAGPSKNIRKIDVPTIKITGPAVVKPKFQSAARRTTEGPARTMQRFNNKSPQQPQKNARLTQVMKAKKPQKPPSGTSTKLLSLMVSQTNGLMTEVVQTPKDFSSSNHFDDFVTSTKVKNASQTMEEIEGVSPIEMLPKRPSGTTSAKRNLLKEATTKALATTQSNEIKENNKPSVSENTTRKFNFIRYSEINISINGEEDEEVKKDVENVEEEEKEPPPKSPDNQNDRTIQNSMHEERTPTKQSIASDDKPVNYLSPFVSVSRGKVSLKKEKEKRNSVYLVNHNEEDGLDSTIQQQEKVSSPHVSPVASEPKSPQYSAEVRRTLEAVRYFRKQLQDEIDRLHKECDIWEEYKSENLEKLQTANCDDMIDVTIGQTRLLTSKKFMQFKGLIDRCEARATGIGDVPNDGSEKTKDVSAEDLEGFWSMLGLQVDNLEKRFENLNRWKGNDWRDPDEVIPKAKTKPKNLTKVKKSAPATKAKPNSALQQMLRRMQADMRNKKANNLLATTDDVVLTPSKVRDRKYFSPAATVVAIPASNRRLSLLRQNSLDSPNRRMSLLAQDSPNRRMSLLARKNSQDSPSRRMSLMPRKNSHDSPSLLKSVLQFREAFDATLVEENNSCGTKRSSVNGKNCTESPRLSSTKMQTDNEAFNSPVVKQRKSILKTPCSAVTRLRNVVFNQKLRVKKFNFITNDGDAIDNSSDEDCNKSTEEDMPPTRQDSDEDESIKEENHRLGTYSLRNRKVRLRPSCEIVIPK